MEYKSTKYSFTVGKKIMVSPPPLPNLAVGRPQLKSIRVRSVNLVAWVRNARCIKISPNREI